MPSTEHLLAFLLAGVALVAIPGPSVLFIVGRALAHGRRAALTSVAGNTTGVVLIVLAVALGIGALATASAAVFSVLKLAGAVYLAYLGVQTWRHRGDLAVALGAAGAPPGRRVFWQGVVVGATNPKVLVLFVALLPQFTDPAGGSPATQMLVLGLLLAVLAATLDSVWGQAGGRPDDDRPGRHPRPHRPPRLTEEGHTKDGGPAPRSRPACRPGFLGASPSWISRS